MIMGGSTTGARVNRDEINMPSIEYAADIGISIWNAIGRKALMPFFFFIGTGHLDLKDLSTFPS
jgi:hypothetical protein